MEKGSLATGTENALNGGGQNPKTLAFNGSSASLEGDKNEVPKVEGYVIKVMKDLFVNKTSVANEDFVETLNAISPELGGVTNLGVFCDIIKVEQTSAVLSDVEELFIHVDTKGEEQPYCKLINDGSSMNPYDFSFYHLLNE